MKKIFLILFVFLLLTIRVEAYPTVLFNPTNGTIVIPTNLNAGSITFTSAVVTGTLTLGGQPFQNWPTNNTGNAVTNAQPVVQIGPGGGTGVNLIGGGGSLTISNSANSAPGTLNMAGGVILAPVLAVATGNFIGSGFISSAGLAGSATNAISDTNGLPLATALHAGQPGNGGGLTNLSKADIASGQLVLTNWNTFIPDLFSNPAPPAFILSGTESGYDGVYTNYNCTNIAAQTQLGLPFWWTQVGSTNIFGFYTIGTNVANWALTTHTNPWLFTTWGGKGDIWYGSSYDPVTNNYGNGGSGASVGPALHVNYGVLGQPNSRVELISTPAARTSILPLIPGIVSIYNTTNLYPQTGNGGMLNNKVENGAIWGAVQKPYRMYYFSPGPNITNGVATDNQTSILYAANYLATNGDLATYTNAGMGVAFIGDIGWDARRNPSLSFATTNWGAPFGSMMWDTNLFPLGIPWLCSSLKSNGIDLILSIYTYTNNISGSGGNGYCCAWSGSSTIKGYTNGVGPGGFVYTNNNYKDVEMMTPDSIPYDESTFAIWGVAGLILNDFSDSSTTFEQLGNLESVASSRFLVPQGFNNPISVYNGNPFSYFNYNAAAVSSGQNNAFESSFKTYFPRQLSLWPYESLASGANKQTTGDLTRGYHNGVTYENFVFIGGATTLRQAMLDFPACRSALNGAYLITTHNGTTSAKSMATYAMISACPVSDISPGNFLNLYSRGYATNGLWFQIETDPLQAFPVLQYDGNITGITNSIWTKQMVAGNFAAYFENETNTGAANLTLKFPSYIQTNTLMVVQDAISGSVISTNANTFTTNLAASASCFLYFYPYKAPVLQVQTLVVYTNFASTNTPVIPNTPYVVTLTNNGVYRLDAQLVSQGLGGSDYPNFYPFCTNATAGGYLVSAQCYFGKLYGNAESGNNGYNYANPIPLSRTGIGASAAIAGSSYNGIAYCNNYSNINANQVQAQFLLTCVVTNAPQNIYFIGQIPSPATDTNTISPGVIYVTQVQ